MDATEFFITWFVLSAALQLYNNHKMNKQLGRMHELNKQIKGAK
ncbi:hypothetical protein [Lactiplantibacillus pentosus]